MVQRQSTGPMKPYTRTFSARLLSVLVLLGCATMTNGQLCEQLVEDTWENLVQTIELSFGFAIVCPFEIRGDGCPSSPIGYDVVMPGTYLLCEGATTNDHACVIDCPGTHFAINQGASLSLDGFTLRGATTSAVQVRRGGMFSSFHSYYQR